MSSSSAETTTSRASTVVPARASGYSPPRGTRGRTSARRCREAADSSRATSISATPKVRTALPGLAK
ncbi:hypothetical protein [Blastococcus sp. TF02-09]|uniref:hypothetical protein n=1 Tax=Blastococcus sp. TF02-09 TaxID=2250576 RepID=UPI001F3D0110|nr:hypothetical protein [Blastococcus sp. TF02-9]